uniref:40S ribosomal protein S26 n=1 Tax=Ditylenchus dipsaci TaxID=166011 RepID=A0A915E8Z7_9BILA
MTTKRRSHEGTRTDEERQVDPMPNCARSCPKTRRSRVRGPNIVEAAAVRDMTDASVYERKFLSVSELLGESLCARPLQLIFGAQIKCMCFVHNMLCRSCTTSLHYCISCAIHSKVVRNRSREARKDRNPPPRFGQRNVSDRPVRTADGGAGGGALLLVERSEEHLVHL